MTFSFSCAIFLHFYLVFTIFFVFLLSLAFLGAVFKKNRRNNAERKKYRQNPTKDFSVYTHSTIKIFQTSLSEQKFIIVGGGEV